MKKILSAIAVLSLLIACGENNKSAITINGQLTNSKDGDYIYIKQAFGVESLDSAAIKDGKFTFKFENTIPRASFLTASKNDRESKFIILEQGTINVTGNYRKLKDVKVTGTEAMNTLHALTAELKPFRDRINNLPKEFGAIAKKLNKDAIESKKAEVQKEISRLRGVVTDTQNRYTKENYGKVFGSYMVFNRKISKLAGVEKQISEISPNAQDGFVKELKIKRDKLASRAIGEIAPNFTVKDTNGEEFSLSDYRGKVVLIEFWGSWAIPSRNIIRGNTSPLYKKYNNEGFEVIGIAMDFDVNKTIESMKADRNTWRNTSGSQVSRQYLISSIPASLLLDRNGVIVAVSMHGEGLETYDTKIKELLNK